MYTCKNVFLFLLLVKISIGNIDCRYIDTFERYRYGEVENIDIDIDRAILKNIDIDIDKAIPKIPIDIDIDKAILQNIDIDKISNRFKFGISNRAICCEQIL